MATAFKFEEMITCAICQEVYQNPMALSCLHTLCGTCINNLKKRPKKYNCIECPLCREMTDVDLLKKDFRTQNLVDILSHQTPKKNVASPSLCQLCHKRDIICKCQDCVKLMCSECSDSHLAIPLCESHFIRSMDDLILEGKSLVEEILAKIKTDKETYDGRLQQLFELSDDLDEAKKRVQIDIDQSESYFLHHIKAYHQNLRSEVNSRVLNERERINAEKGDIIDGICKLENTAQLVTHIAALSDDSAVVAASLERLGQVNLPEVTTSIIDTIGFLDIKLLQKPAYNMSQVLELVFNTSPGKVQREGLNMNFMIESPQQPSLSSNGNNSDETLQVCTVGDNMDENQNGKQSIREAKLKENCDKKLSYCDEVTRLIDGIHSKLLTKCNLVRSSKSMNSLTDMVSSFEEDVLHPTTYPIHSLSELTRKRLSRREDILLQKFDCPQKLRLIGDHMWCVYKDKIHIYNIFNNTLLRTFKHKKLQYARSVSKASNGDHFIACEYGGLLVFGPTCLYQDSFHGSFSDVTAGNEKIFALEHKQGSILVFISEERSSRTRGIPHWDWKLVMSIQRTDTPSLDDSLLVSGDTIYVGSYRGDSILLFNQKGEAIGQMGHSGRAIGELWRPRLCCVDRQGCVLVADFYNNRLQLLDRELKWHGVDRIQGLNFPWDGVWDARCGLMVLQQCNINHKIIQFVALNE